MMHSRFRTKRWFTAAFLTVVSATAAFFFLLMGSHSQAPPPDTVGNDVVVSGTGFSEGDRTDTKLVSGAQSGAESLALEADRAEGTYTSDPVRPEYSINAVGLHWLADTPAGTEVAAQIRFSSDGNDWGDWKKVYVDSDELPDHIASTKSAGETIGQLVFADFEARYFQYRVQLKAGPDGVSPSISRLTASYIDAKGYHIAALSPENIANKINAIVKPAPASADPYIIPRSQWGADDAYTIENWPPEYVAPRKIIVHHTVTSNNDPDPFATMRSIYYYHAKSLGWGDIGYNYLIDWLGRIYEGRYGGNGVVGAHALSWNPGSIGVSAMGNYEEAYPSEAMINSFVSLMNMESNRNQIDPYGTDYMNGTYSNNYLGHRDVYSTACPGGFLYPYMQYFRDAAHNTYVPIPVIGGIRIKWDALSRAPGAPVNEEYRVPASGDPWVGQAQDFTNGRLFWDYNTHGVYWVHGGILAKYDSFGRETGRLGVPSSDEYSIAGGAGNDFAAGKIYWTGGVGAYSVNGAIMQKLLDDGGVAVDGFPTSDEYDIAGVPDGRAGNFQRSRIYWTPSGSSRSVRGGILGKYLQLGGPASFLGLPASDESDIAGLAGGRQHDFSGGKIYWAPGVGVFSVQNGAVMNKYLSQGGPAGDYGMPVSDEYAAGPGRAQNMQNAMVTWDGSAGAAYGVTRGIMGKYRILGGPTGPYGFANTDEIDVAGVSGGRESDFASGRIYWSQSTGTFGLQGPIYDKFMELGGPPVNGLPVTDAYPAYSGWAQNTQKAIITWDSSIGAHLVYGGIMGKYQMLGGPAGALHLATSDEVDVPGVSGARETDFQNGRVYWSLSTGAHTVNGGIFIRYMSYCDPGTSNCGPTSLLGLPTSDEYGYGAGRRSDFQGGYIYWDAQSGAQVFVRAAATVTAASAFEARDGNGNLLATLSSGQVASVSYSGGVYYLQAPGVSVTSGSYVRFTASGGVMQVTSYHDVPSWDTSLDDNKFRGAIEVRYSPASSAVWVVDDIPVEDYLKGIAESSPGSPAEFLKTMSVAARGYAVWHLDRGGKYGTSEIFHLKNSRNGNGDDQQYKGYGLETRFPDQVTAVNNTAGQVVTYNGSTAITTYFSNSDGRTRSAQEAWGIDYWPWLQSVSDPDCNGMTLNGHGVGLSGHGALARALDGDSYQTILGHYYTGTSIQPVNTSRNIRIAITRVS